MKKFVLGLFLLIPVLLSGCLTPSEQDRAVQLCVQACQLAKQNGTDLSNGPCLSNEIIPGWVCDVAHSPRLPVDDQPENQSPAYGLTAKHFVEVDPECKFIRAA
ncbi:MAG: hypothetical protein DRP12_02245 [Candidatus Aenigmatarchaeota archaeon]|nr:MAG: hypothetical protein DRP12_02245 [Candidatus Aenigmarchaeota archaeon]